METTDRLSSADDKIVEVQREYTSFRKFDYFVIPMFIIWSVLFSMCSDQTRFTADHPQRIYVNQMKNASAMIRPPAASATTRPPAVPAVFVLTKTNNKPMVVDFEGRVNRDVFIDMGEFNELHWGCGTTFYGDSPIGDSPMETLPLESFGISVAITVINMNVK